MISEHADKKNHFTIQVNALREGAKTGTGQKSRAGQNNGGYYIDHEIDSHGQLTELALD